MKIKTMKEIQAVPAYLQALATEFQTGHAREHSYRPALKALFEALTGLRVVNEPKASAHGQPDFIFLDNMLPMCWAEAKDIDVNLDKVEKSEQMGRYYGYSNLVLTNGLEFRFYKNGTAYGDPIVLGKTNGNAIITHEDAYEMFVRRFKDFIADPIDTIRSAEHLAKIMGGKARRLRQNVLMMLDTDYDSDKKGKEDIAGIMAVLKQQLIHDLTDEQFADIYAQTLVYGLFVARYHDDTKENFSRSEARDRIPASNHLLQQFFDHIAGANFVLKLSHIVDELCNVFIHADVHSLVHGLYQKKGDNRDPIIHFYEDFLKEYDPALRKQRGVFYTPLPVVKYIVRSVDKILQKHFDLPEGLADRAQTEWEYEVQGKKSKKQIDKVQILDPAVGTGTFMHEVIEEIYKRFKGQEGIWNQYVNDHLLPRLHGFELMMASYTIAHLKLSMSLKESGVEKFDKRLRVFLTNSLEEAPKKDDSLFKFIGFQEAITEEAEMAAEVKRDMPIMVVMGNPPYSGISQNNEDWITELIEDYKKEPGGREKLKERKHWLNDDYVKFIRFSEYLINKNGGGILAMITNHSYLSNPTFRGMRWHLLKSFDYIYVLDLHGNVREMSQGNDNSDENVFDIQQGVSVILAIKTENNSALGNVYRADQRGTRESKYTWLENNNFDSTKWEKVLIKEPLYLFQNSNNESSIYEKGIKLDNLFIAQSMGVTTARDNVVVDIEKKRLIERISRFCNSDISDAEIRHELFPKKKDGKYKAGDTRGWKLSEARKAIQDNVHESLIQKIAYRPFDTRYIYYSPRMVDWGREKIMNNFLMGNNISINLVKLGRDSNAHNYLVTNKIVDKSVTSSLDNANCFPLYVYSDSSTITNAKRTPNLNMELLQPFLDKLKFSWIEDGVGNGKDTCGPEDIFDYIYAVLHSPTYCERYKEFLKIDFPRVPFTSDQKIFWKLVALGRELRLLHLMESTELGTLITKFPVSGSNEVGKPSFDSAQDDKVGKVWINKEQYFEGVPEEAWEFPIGGYQPAQKWLKDRKGRTLNSDDILHYQKMIRALVETGKLMEEIDKIVSFPMK